MDGPKVYIAGALTGLDPPEAGRLKAMFEDVGRLCEELGLTPYLPHLKTDPIRHPMVTPREVYITDHDQVAASAIVIAFVHPPSLGVGMELAIAAYRGAEVILVYHLGTSVSRMALGNPAVVGVVAYSEWSQALAQLRSLLLTRSWGHLDSLSSGGALGPRPTPSQPFLPLAWGEFCIRFLLPLYFNNEHAVDQNIFSQLEYTLAQRFGGWTRFDHVEGGWWFEGYLCRDHLRCYEVVVKREEFSYHEFTHMKAVLAREFEQIEIFMVGSPARLL
jgi:hypothetical protein